MLKWLRGRELPPTRRRPWSQAREIRKNAVEGCGTGEGPALRYRSEASRLGRGAQGAGLFFQFLKTAVG